MMVDDVSEVHKETSYFTVKMQECHTAVLHKQRVFQPLKQ